MADLIPVPSPNQPLFFGDEGNPLVIVLHDWFGRLPGLVDFAIAVAHNGYRVAVPDMFKGWCTTNPVQAETLMSELDLGSTLAIIDEIIAAERANGSSKVATVGFAMGGWLALVHAEGGETDAVVAYYATLSAADHGVIPAPVLLHLAETDDWNEGEEPQDFIGRLDQHGTPVKHFTYLATEHSFANASLPDRVDARAAALAFARTVSFLDGHLKD